MSTDTTTTPATLDDLRAELVALREQLDADAKIAEVYNGKAYHVGTITHGQFRNDVLSKLSTIVYIMVVVLVLNLIAGIYVAVQLHKSAKADAALQEFLEQPADDAL